MKTSSVRMKMLLGFSIIILLVLFLNVYNYIRMGESSRNTEDIVEEKLPLLILNNDLVLNMSEREGLLRGYLLYKKPVLIDLMEEQRQYGMELDDELLSVMDTPEVHDILEKKAVWGKGLASAIDLFDEGKVEEAMDRFDNELRPISEEIIEDLKSLADESEEGITTIGKDAIEANRTALILTSSIAVAVIIASIFIAFYTAGKISTPIRHLKERVVELANGNLSLEPLEKTSNDEIGELVEAVNVMNENMYTLLHEINDVSEQVSNQSQELNQSANEVKAGSEQVAITMEELARGSETQASRAGDLSQLMTVFVERTEAANEEGAAIQEASQNVLHLTNEGTSLMQKSTDQMGYIHEMVMDAVEKVGGLDEKSQEISQLVLVIQSIAEQTNLLALNAAIEAARAGEYGQGFAVVAEEVRKLAEQSSESTTQITNVIKTIQLDVDQAVDMIQENTHKVSEGIDKTATVETSFELIENTISDVSQFTGEVAQTIGELNEESVEIERAVARIREAAETNATIVNENSAASEEQMAAVEQISAASEHLAQLAEDLRGEINTFKL